MVNNFNSIIYNETTEEGLQINEKEYNYGPLNVSSFSDSYPMELVLKIIQDKILSPVLKLKGIWKGIIITSEDINSIRKELLLILEQK